MTHRADHCLNCGAATPEAFCARCGQRNADYRESLRELGGEVVQEFLQVDSRIAHTVVPFLIQPGKLTQEFTAGRRVSYSSPLRLFLLLSVSYFFALSLVAKGQHGFHVTPDGMAIEFSDDDAPDAGAARPQAAPKSAVPVEIGSRDSTSSVREQTRVEGWFDAFFNRSREKWSVLGPEQRSERMLGFFLSWLPRVVFVLMPLFAVMVGMFFPRPKRWFVEHLIFALHIHAYLFFLLLVELAIPRAAVVLPFVALAYLALALRRVYAPSFLGLVVKLVLLVLGYSLLLLGTLLVLTLVAVSWA